MDRKLVLGTTAFAVLSVLLGLIVNVLLELAGAKGFVVDQVGTFLIAVPLALIAARRAGRVSRISVLFASVAIAAAALWAIVYTLNAIAEPVGGHVGWSNLLNSMNWQNTVFGTTAMLLVPQLWLSVLNRVAANNSFKPRPLRGSA